MPSDKQPNQATLDFGGGAPSTKEEPRVLSVSEVVRAAGRAIEARFSSIWVEGEISNLSLPRSGHIYFTLKDAEAQLQAVMWRSSAARLKFQLEDGMCVRAFGRLTIYDAQGKFQMYADRLEPAGLGELQLAFEQLKKKLAAEGLFEAARKRPLPPWPKKIGVVTSVTGAAVRDILHVAERRGRASFVISPCQVQGADAPRDIVRALRAIERHEGIEVIIIGRGGGSAEDLAAFNDEALARAICACPVPVVSAVGHEVDFTIADFVADVRAPTPSAAAEMVVSEWARARQQLDDVARRIVRAGTRVIGEGRLRVDDATTRMAGAFERAILRRRRLSAELFTRLSTQHPRARLQRNRAEIVGLRTRLDARARQELERRRRAFFGLAGKLDALSPLGVLARGYALVQDKQGHVVKDATEVKVGADVRVRLGRGELGCRVQSVEDEE